jgi:hypothetical protein
MGIREPHPFACEPIHMGRRDFGFCVVAADIAVTQIIGEDEDDAWFALADDLKLGTRWVLGNHGLTRKQRQQTDDDETGGRLHSLERFETFADLDRSRQ